MNDIQRIQSPPPVPQRVEQPGQGGAITPAPNEYESVPRVEVSHQIPDINTSASETADWEELFKELEIYALEQNFQLKFSVDKASGRTVIKVIDTETQKVIREIPPEETLKIAAYFKNMAQSIIDEIV